MKTQVKTSTVMLTEGELLSLLHLAEDAVSLCAVEPFKHWQRDDIRPYEEIRGACQKLAAASKAFEVDD